MERELSPRSRRGLMIVGAAVTVVAVAGGALLLAGLRVERTADPVAEKVRAAVYGAEQDPLRRPIAPTAPEVVAAPPVEAAVVEGGQETSGGGAVESKPPAADPAARAAERARLQAAFDAGNAHLRDVVRRTDEVQRQIILTLDSLGRNVMPGYEQQNSDLVAQYNALEAERFVAIGETVSAEMKLGLFDNPPQFRPLPSGGS